MHALADLRPSPASSPTTCTPMRILVCDRWVICAQAVADLLTTRGKQVVAVVYNLDDALAVLRTTPVDIVLLNMASGPDNPLGRLAQLRQLAPEASVVLVSGHIDADLIAAARAARVDAIADKRLPVAEVIRLLDRVHAGDHPAPDPEPAAPIVPRPRCGPANDAQRLAAFLTPRERQVLSALVCGGDTKTLARTLGITSTTARCHIQSLLTKMGAHSRLEVATTAIHSGMVSPDTGRWLIAP